MAAVLVVPTLLFAYVAYASYHQAFDLADERIDRALAVSAEQALRIFRSIDVTLDSVDQITLGKSDGVISETAAELSQRLKQFTRAFPDISSIWVLDRNGDAVVSSLFYPIPPSFNAPERSFLKKELAKGLQPEVGRVVEITLSRSILFPVSKQRLDASGNLIGYTLISVLPSAFEQVYATLRGNSSASFALIRSDGVVLARHPVTAQPGIVLDPSSGFGQLIQATPDGGRYTAVSQVDGVERRFAVRKLQELPVYVSSSMETKEVVRSWAMQMAGYLAIAVPAVALISLFIVLTARRTKAFYAEVERREMLEQNIRQTQRIEAVGQLTGGIAHDFNNLLTVISGNLQMAIRQIPDGKPRMMLENAQRGAARAAELTRRMLAFSRKQALNPKPIDVNRLVSTMSEMLVRVLGETIIIETVRGAGLWEIEADITELESALLNLAVNARDAMPNGGKLTIETANAYLDENYSEAVRGLETGQYVLIAVTDTGGGMPKSVVDKAFDPFFTTKPPGAGTGLGLSQAYGFVKQSGGHIQIYSEVGEGTTVKIYLPRQPTAGAYVVEDEPTEAIPQGNGQTILVTEDDPDVRTYVLQSLIDLGYKVIQAADGQTALAILRRQRVDLLLTDVVMPGMNGRELVDEARKHNQDLKAIFMTGYSRNAIVHHGRVDPGVSLLTKPFSLSALAQQVRRQLAGQDSQA
ncbi:MAG TPA: response regulator [Xanthobacteraceae bacterium]|nr:response regulator [Xanthobacteraceae bacterium]